MKSCQLCSNKMSCKTKPTSKHKDQAYWWKIHTTKCKTNNQLTADMLILHQGESEIYTSNPETSRKKQFSLKCESDSTQILKINNMFNDKLPLVMDLLYFIWKKVKAEAKTKTFNYHNCLCHQINQAATDNSWLVPGAADARRSARALLASVRQGSNINNTSRYDINSDGWPQFSKFKFLAQGGQT